MSACLGNAQSPPSAPPRSVTAPLCHPTVSTETVVTGGVRRDSQPAGSRQSRDITEARRAETLVQLEEAAPMRSSKGVGAMCLSSAWSQPVTPGLTVGDTVRACAEESTACKLSSIDPETSSLV